jgi:hypothetical protein
VQAAQGEAFDGIDLRPHLAAGGREVERDLFWRITRPGQRVRAVRSGKWKFVLDGGIVNLFDLSKDPGETRDLYWVYPDIGDGLRKKIEEWEKSVGNT